jgi:hypothetical protein
MHRRHALRQRKTEQAGFQGALPGTVAGISSGGGVVPGPEAKLPGRSRIGVITIATRLPLSKFCARRPDAEHAVLPIFVAEIVKDLILYPGVLGNLGLPDESRTVRAADPHQRRAAAPDSLGLLRY